MPAMPPARPGRENDSAPSEQVRAPTGDAAPDAWAEGAEETQLPRMTETTVLVSPKPVTDGTGETVNGMLSK
jgi:hypothetical protein